MYLRAQKKEREKGKRKDTTLDDVGEHEKGKSGRR